ncbi:MAG: hypothetical protein MZU91_01450 [Desulfosudis oleivorans]|nr:hypothetical protein [Desulfosudis oleivorans]
MEKLKVWRKKSALKSASSRMSSCRNHTWQQLPKHPRKSLDELALLMKETPTRVEKYGAQILKSTWSKKCELNFTAQHTR